MTTFYDRVLDLVFPPRCPGCRMRGVLFCPRCLERCRGLRVDLPQAQKRGGALLSTATGLYHYDAPLREAILMLKYRRRRALAVPLGALMLEALPSTVHECAAIVPVPLHPGRQRERGFNQSALLADVLGAALQKPILTNLQRVRSTAHQVGLRQDARETNVRGAFTWSGAAPPPCLLLLDDVLTTGATLRECARALRASGASDVHGLTLAGGG